MAARKMNRFTFAFVGDNSIPFGEASIEDALNWAKAEGEADEEDVIEIYELVPVGKYKLHGWVKV